ncbi:hypothetical protein ZWY2020_031577 [Hordeum vulgare]|nr:hypothetical protein ZWY2020_031577 [Hordeum vulgare]
MADLPAAAAASRRSGRRSYVLADAKCHIGDRDNATTAHGVTSRGRDIKVTFELADPPGVSRCFVHCPCGLAESRHYGDPAVLSSADALVLLVVPFIDGSKKDRGAPSRRSHGSKYGRRGEYNDFFVYTAGPGAPSLCLLPGVGPDRCPDIITLAGVMPLDGAHLNSKDYAVVFPMQHKSCSRDTNDSTSVDYILGVYRSDTSKWQCGYLEVPKHHNPEVIMRHQGTRAIFAGRGRLGWVNHWHGILLCNVLDQYPAMRLIQWPVPLPCDLVPRFGMGADDIYARPFHDVVISNGMIRFVELKFCRRSDNRNEEGVIGQGWTVSAWNRGGLLKQVAQEVQCQG